MRLVKSKMVRNILFLASLVIQVASTANAKSSQANRDPNSMPYPSWSATSPSVCTQYTPAGYPIQKLDSDICRKVQPTYNMWTPSTLSQCVEMSPGGFYIQVVSPDICRKEQETYFGWSATSPAYCGEFSPAGFLIAKVTPDHC